MPAALERRLTVKGGYATMPKPIALTQPGGEAFTNRRELAKTKVNHGN